MPKRTYFRLAVAVAVLLAATGALGQANFCATPHPPPAGPAPAPPNPQCETCTRICRGSPCYVGSGIYTTSATDLSIRTTGAPIEITRNYESHRTVDGPFGIGWTSSITPRVYVTRFRSTTESFAKEVYVTLPSGFQLRFTSGTGGSWVAPVGRREILSSTANGWTLQMMPSGTVLTFATDGQIISLLDEYGNGLQYTYDANGRLATVSDARPSGRSINVVYGATGRIDTITDSTGRVVRYDYDASLGTLLKAYDPSSAVEPAVTYTYETKRFGTVLKKIQDRWLRVLTELEWNAAGQLLSYTEGEYSTSNPQSPGEKYTYSYGTQSTLKTHSLGSHTYAYDQLGRITGDTQYDADGRVTLSSDAVGCRYYTYNARGNLETLKVRSQCSDSSPFAGQWNYAYDSAFPDKVATVSGTNRPTWKYVYYAAGNPAPGSLKEVRRVGRNGAEQIVASYAYNAAGQVTNESSDTGPRQFLYFSSGDLEKIIHGGADTVYAYDALGRVTSVTDPAGRVTSYTYDVLDRIKTVTLPKPSTTFPKEFKTEYTYGYDATLGLSYTEAKDPNDVVTRQSFDALGHLVRSTDGLGQVTKYTYKHNLLEKIEDAVGGVTTYAYNAERKLQSTTFPGNLTESYLYNGEYLDRVTDRKGVVRKYGYDALGRNVGFSFPDLTHPGTNFTVAIGSTFEGDQVKSLTDWMSPTSATTTYTYDNFFRRETETLPSGYKITYTYVPGVTERVQSYTLTPPAQSPELSHTVTYGHDPIGRVNSVTSSRIPGGSFTILYKADGQYDKITFPNNSERVFGYDGQGRLTTLANTFPGIGNIAYAYEYDRDWVTNTLARLGQRTSVTTTSTIAGVVTGTTKYEYDLASQLTSATDLSPGGVVTSWQYDAIGNRLTQTAGSNVTSYVYDPVKKQRMTSAGGTSYAYDNNGNVTGIGAHTLAWDPLNRMKSYDTAQYAYDALGRRTTQVYPGSPTYTYRYVHQGNDTIREAVDVLNSVTDYVFAPGIDEPLASVVRTKPGFDYVDDVRYFAADALGSIVARVSVPGGGVTAWRYTPWGEGGPTAGTAGTPFSYTGRETSAYGLFYRARYYEPGTGRFLSEDPLGGLDPKLGFERDYMYVGNDPILFGDPLGLLETYRTGACGSRYVGPAGGANHLPGILGRSADRLIGNNLVAFCVHCPVGKTPSNITLNPTPPTSRNGVPGLTLQPNTSVPGIDTIRQQCGCAGPDQQLHVANVRTSLALSPGALENQRIFYGVEFRCNAPGCFENQR